MDPAPPKIVINVVTIYSGLSETVGIFTCHPGIITPLSTLNIVPV